MLRIACGGLLVVLVAGCGASAPPLPPTARTKAPAAAPPVVHDVIFDKTASPEEEAATKAAQLADRLVEPDESTRRRACQELSSMGRAGYPYLVKAVKGDVYELSLIALEALPPPALHEYSRELVPLLLARLDDSDPVMRRLSAERLSWFDRRVGADEVYPGPQAQDRLKALQKAAKLDKDSSVRGLAQASANQVQAAINGRLAQLDARTGSGLNPPPTGNERPKREIPR